MVHFSRFRSVFLAPDLMVNHVVNDLRAVLGVLREEGVWWASKVVEYDYGKFGSIMDPDRNRIEFWVP